MGKSKKNNSVKEKSIHKKHKQQKKGNKKKLKPNKSPPSEKEDPKKNSSREKTTIKPEDDSFAIPIELMDRKSYLPETPEEYKHRQSRIRRETVGGRTRLIKGDGEILEEIVTKGQHLKINKSATINDGKFFQENTVEAAFKHK